jgi:hypothetical protein
MLSPTKAFDLIVAFDGQSNFAEWDEKVKLALKQIKKDEAVSAEMEVFLLKKKLLGEAKIFVDSLAKDTVIELLTL